MYIRSAIADFGNIYEMCQILCCMPCEKRVGTQIAHLHFAKTMPIRKNKKSYFLAKA
jgi:hypothetical protein